MKEGESYTLDPTETEIFFKLHAEELKNTQMFCDYAMDILDELMEGNNGGHSYVHLTNIIKRQNIQNFAFCYIRNVIGFPVVERFFIEDKLDRMTYFIIKHDAKEELKIIKPILLRKREL